MKKIYQTFEEIADDFTDGFSWTHQCSKHTSDECLAWQRGVHEFSQFLDKIGIKIIENPDFCEILWNKFICPKPKKIKAHRKEQT